MRANEDFVGFERRYMNVGTELEFIGSTERGKKNGSTGGDMVGFEIVIGR